MPNEFQRTVILTDHDGNDEFILLEAVPCEETGTIDLIGDDEYTIARFLRADNMLAAAKRLCDAAGLRVEIVPLAPVNPDVPEYVSDLGVGQSGGKVTVQTGDGSGYRRELTPDEARQHAAQVLAFAAAAGRPG